MDLFTTFTSNFVIGGFIIGTVSVITKYLSTAVGSWVYSLPMSYIPIMLSVAPRVQKTALICSLFACVNTVAFFGGAYLSLYVYNENFIPLILLMGLSSSIYMMLMLTIKNEETNVSNQFYLV